MGPGGAAAAASAHPDLDNQLLKTLIEDFARELADAMDKFTKQSNQIIAWDRQIVANGDRIVRLNNDVQRVLRAQTSLDESLSFVASQQEGMHQELEDLRRSVDQLCSQSAGNMGTQQDLEREALYSMAESLNTELTHMTEDLRSVIDGINAEHAVAVTDENAISDVSQILDAHLDSLRWIETKSVELQRKMDDTPTDSGFRQSSWR
eukprot:Amastigsp_a684104_22.p1 type:complete len:207 gc:universal Amastigsp_a684104_22:655-35(-)